MRRLSGSKQKMMVSSDMGIGCGDGEDTSKFSHGIQNKIQILKVNFQGPARNSPLLILDILQNGKPVPLPPLVWKALPPRFPSHLKCPLLKKAFFGHPISPASSPTLSHHNSLCINISSWCTVWHPLESNLQEGRALFWLPLHPQRPAQSLAHSICRMDECIHFGVVRAGRHGRARLVVKGRLERLRNLCIQEIPGSSSGK